MEKTGGGGHGDRKGPQPFKPVFKATKISEGNNSTNKQKTKKTNSDRNKKIVPTFSDIMNSSFKEIRSLGELELVAEDPPETTSSVSQGEPVSSTEAEVSRVQV